MTRNPRNLANTETWDASTQSLKWNGRLSFPQPACPVRIINIQMKTRRPRSSHSAQSSWPHIQESLSPLSLSLVGSSLLYKLRSHTANDNSTYFSHILLQNAKCGTSLVVEWLRIYLPMQDMGSIPRPEKFHMLQSNWAHVPQLLSSLTYSSCSTTTEATAKRRIAPTRCN